jgi:hypothetical protein
MTDYGSIGVYKDLYTSVFDNRPVYPDLGMTGNIYQFAQVYSVPGFSTVLSLYDGIGYKDPYKLVPGIYTPIYSPNTGLANVANFSVVETLVTNLYQLIPTWAYSDNDFMDTTGYIEGIVKFNGLAYEGAIVRLYYEPNGFFIDYRITGPSGAYRFDFLETGKPYYTVIGYIAGYEAIKYNNVIPIHV